MTTRKRLAVRLDPVERQTVDALARACGLPLAEYMRRCALHQTVRALPRLPEVNLKVYSELGRIGNNINQISASLNKQQLDGGTGAQRVAAALPKLYELIQDTRRQLVEKNTVDDEASE